MAKSRAILSIYQNSITFATTSLHVVTLEHALACSLHVLPAVDAPCSMQPASALQRLKEARRASREQHQQGQQHAAASSDADNEAYLQRINSYLEQLALGQAPSHQPAATPGAQPHHTSTAPQLHIIAAVRRQSPAVSAAWHGSIAAGWRTGPTDAAGVLTQVSERPLLCSAAQQDGSGDIVVGSSDHALYVVDPRAGRMRRTLYSKTKGHTEWVTTVCCLPGGRVLSGGMDGRLWLWPAAGAAGTELKAAHNGPVSKVAALQPVAAAAAVGSAVAAHPPEQASGQLHTDSRTAGSSSGRGERASSSKGRAGAVAAGVPVLAASCSYDKTVKLWSVNGQVGKQVAVMDGHKGPVLELAVAPQGGALVTGDRKGGLICWDVDTASSSWSAHEAHAGHITALAWQHLPPQDTGGTSSSTTVLSGGQDGILRVWDSRSGSCVAQPAVHASPQGSGAIGGIVTVSGGSSSSNQELVVTAGADKTLRVVDPAASYRVMATVQLPDFPYSLAAVGSGLVVCGCGDGSVHVVDVVNAKTLYALGAGRAAVRALEVSSDTLVCCGDDGHVISYQFL